METLISQALALVEALEERKRYAKAHGYLGQYYVRLAARAQRRLERRQRLAADLIAEAGALLDRLQQEQLDIYYAGADYDTPAGMPLPAGAVQRLDRLRQIEERAALRLLRRDLAAQLLH